MTMTTTMATKHITSKNIAFRVRVEDSANNSDMRTKLSTFCSRRHIDNVFVSENGDVLLSSETKKIGLNAGMDTLRDLLGLTYPPILLSQYRPLPYEFFNAYFAGGYNPNAIVYATGDMFAEETIRSTIRRQNETITRAATKQRNEEIARKRTHQLVADGTISFANAIQIDNAKRFIERRRRDDASKNDLDGAVTYTLERYGCVNDDDFVPTKLPPANTDAPPATVTVIGRPGNHSIKRKHLYVYSKLPGFGKSYTLAGTFVDAYNAHVVEDLNNFSNVPTNTQFLIFDEVGTDVGRHLEFGKLKAFTGGRARGASGNVKSFGDSYIPREDVQLVQLSNESMYDVYGTWDVKLQRRVIGRETLAQLEARFVIVRLDGDRREDKIRCMHPKDWSNDDFENQIVSLFTRPADVVVRPTRAYDRVEFCIDVTKRARTVWRSRYGDARSGLFVNFLKRVTATNTVATTSFYFPCNRVTIDDILNDAYSVSESTKQYSDMVARLSAIETTTTTTTPLSSRRSPDRTDNVDNYYRINYIESDDDYDDDDDNDDNDYHHHHYHRRRQHHYNDDDDDYDEYSFAPSNKRQRRYRSTDDYT